MFDLVAAIHDECHEHLRDADKKRDELIGFYAVVVGLLFAAYDKVDVGLKGLLAFVVALVGVFVVLAVIHYRKWHTLYSNCFRALQIAARRNPKVTREGIELAWKSLDIGKTFWSKFELLNPLRGTEAATFDALLVLSFLPWYLIPSAVPCLVLFHVPNDIVGYSLGFFLFYLPIVTLLGMYILYRAKKQDQFENWILQPFATEPSVPESVGREEPDEERD